MPSRNASVFLGDYYAGDLTQLLDGRSVFSFSADYMNDPGRPTLSLSFKNVLHDVRSKGDVVSPSGRLSPFFSNLLPEGKLRTYLAERARIRETQEFPLLMALSDDLPGAVIIRPEGDEENVADDTTAETPNQKSLATQLRFSLAGVQLKFSGDLVNSKIVIPTQGVGGHWIVKLPSPGYPNVNELEYAMLSLAKETGINVPDIDLVPLDRLENLPGDFPDFPEFANGQCLISRRFDRTLTGERIHMEDFAQVFNIYEKYDERYNYQSIANVIAIECGLEDTMEYIRRLVHMLATGNADMHMKNWALIYPDGRNARLAPAYDYVPTVVYRNIMKSLPHKIAGEKEMNKVSLETFRRLAAIAALPERKVLKTVRETVSLLKEKWRILKKEERVGRAAYIETLDQHMNSLPFMLGE